MYNASQMQVRRKRRMLDILDKTQLFHYASGSSECKFMQVRPLLSAPSLEMLVYQAFRGFLFARFMALKFCKKQLILLKNQHCASQMQVKKV